MVIESSQQNPNWTAKLSVHSQNSTLMEMWPRLNKWTKGAFEQLRRTPWSSLIKLTLREPSRLSLGVDVLCFHIQFCPAEISVFKQEEGLLQLSVLTTMIHLFICPFPCLLNASSALVTMWVLEIQRRIEAWALSPKISKIIWGEQALRQPPCNVTST